jgi:hypothetical protein
MRRMPKRRKFADAKVKQLRIYRWSSAAWCVKGVIARVCSAIQQIKIWIFVIKHSGGCFGLLITGWCLSEWLITD